MEANAARQATPAEWNQDDSNDMWEDQEEEEEEEEDGLAGQLLSDILATSKYEEDYYEDDEEDDPDALKDPSTRSICRHISQTSFASLLSSPVT